MSQPPDLYACLFVKEFPAQALLRLRPDLHSRPCVVMEGEAPAQSVCSLNTKARLLGMERGMTSVEVDTFPEPVVLPRSARSEMATKAILLECAGAFSPRVEDRSETNAFLCGIGIAGTKSLFGPPDTLARSLLERVRALGISASVTISGNLQAAVSLAKGLAPRVPVQVIMAGGEAAALSSLPLSVLDLNEKQSETFELWGIRTLGMLAMLPEAELVARMGQECRRLRQLALGFAGYFLIVWDIVQFCKRNDILIQGRGSAANSAVCYALEITAIDPVGMDLLFERFLSESRGEWPDIDLDLPSEDKREQAIQYVYRRYGELGAAMTANVITYRGKSAAREVGKVLGFDQESLTRLTSLVSHFEWRGPTDTMAHSFQNAGFDLKHPRIAKYLELCMRIQDLPRHLGQHSGGMVICQGQLNSIVPLERASMPGRTVVQWDKEDCADLGIIKVDLLGLGMMAVLKDCLALIPEHYGDTVDLAQLPEDKEVYLVIQRADTVGMFQIESRAQMASLPRTCPDCFYGIIVNVGMIRPGPIHGDMVHPYMRRRQKKEPITYPHPSLKPVLERTLGVPLFQEQLLRMAMIVANFTGAEADELRRAVGMRRSWERMKNLESKLRGGMKLNGIDEKTQDTIIKYISSFALYGFPESHAANFALIAYASAYFKVRYLAAFTCAILAMRKRL
jgi:DNA polymerase III alpha subunit